MKRYTIRNGLVLATSIYSLLLMGGLLLFFGLNGERNLFNQSVHDIENKERIFRQLLDRELRDTRAELSALQSRISVLNGHSTEIVPVLIQFFHNYPYKYDQIAWTLPERDRVIQARPVREFDALDIEMLTIPNGIFSHETISNPIIGRFGHIIRFVDDHGEMTLSGQVHLNHLLDRVLEQLNLNHPFNYYLCDSSGVILHAENTVSLNKHIQDGVIPESPALISRTARIDSPALCLVITKDWQAARKVWRNKIGQGGLFAFFLILLAVFVSAAIGQKFSRSLHAVSDLASRVAEGNFDVCLPADRNDELGGLFASFNRMTRRLKSNVGVLHEMNEELQIKINELTSARQELTRKQRLALLGEAISKISHEIQNKIGGVSLWVQNMERVIPNEESNQLYLSELKKAVNSLNQTLIRFKRFYRAPQLNLSKTRISEWLEQSTLLLQNELDNKQISLKLDIQKNLPDIFLDQEQMKEALINLLLNAAYFTPQRGEISITATCGDQFMQISVCDSGPGFSEDPETLFQPFFTTKSSGSGLGLSIVQKIVLSHHGTITAISRPHSGAEFLMTLPLTNENR